jgi:hypothetical protein
MAKPKKRPSRHKSKAQWARAKTVKGLKPKKPKK